MDPSPASGPTSPQAQPPQRLAREEIESRVPHAGNMCMLDRVNFWDEQSIECSADFVRDDNPLMHEGRLPACAVIEYAAQAMAVHGQLVNEASAPDRSARRGFLVGLRSIRMSGRWVDREATGLRIDAQRQSGDEAQVLYAFTVTTEGLPVPEEVASGRALVVLDADSLER